MKDRTEIIKSVEKSLNTGSTMEYFLLRNKSLYREDLEELLDKELSEIKDSDFDVVCNPSKLSFVEIPFISESKFYDNEMVYINDFVFDGVISARKVNKAKPIKVEATIEAYWEKSIDVLDARNTVYIREDKEERIQKFLT